MRYLRKLVFPLLLLALLLHALPMIGRDLIVYALYQQGAQQVHLKSLSVNWLRSELTLEKLSLVAADNEVLQVDQLTLDLYLSALLNRQLRLSELRLNGASATLTQSGNRLMLGPLVLLQGAAAEARSAEVQSGLFSIGVEHIEVIDTRLLYLTDQQNFELQIDQFELAELYQWRPLDPTAMRLAGRLNGAAIDLDSSLLPLPDDKQLSFAITIDQLALQPFGTLLNIELGGALSATLSVEVDLRAAALEQAQISLAGELTADNLSGAINGNRFATAALVVGPQLRVSLDGKQFAGRLDLRLEQTTLSDQIAQLSLNNVNAMLAPQADASAPSLHLELDAGTFIQGERRAGLNDLKLTLTPEELAAGVLWQPEVLSAVLDLKHVAYQDAAYRAELNGLQAQPRVIELSGGQPKLQLQAELAGLSLVGEALASQLNALRLDASWQNGSEAGPLALDLNVQTQRHRLGAAEIRSAGFRYSASGDWHTGSALLLDQELLLIDLDLGLENAQLVAQHLAHSGRLTLDLESLTGALDGSGQVSGVRYRDAQTEAAIKEFNAKSAVRWRDSDGVFTLNGPLNIDFAGLSASLADAQTLAIEQGRSDSKLDIGAQASQILSPLQLSAVRWQQAEQQVLVADLNTVLELQLKPDRSFAELRGQQFSASSWELQGPVTGTIAAIDLASLTLDPQHLQLSTIGLQDPQIRVVKAPAVAEAKAATASQDALAEQTQRAEDLQLPLVVEFAGLQARGKRQLSYLDQSLIEPMKLDLALRQFELGAWSSASAKPVTLKLAGTLNSAATIELNAAYTPLLARPDGRWQLDARQLALPWLSPLAQTHAGYLLSGGVMNLNSSGSLKRGVLDGQNEIRLQRLDLQKGSDDKAALTDQLFTMPLPTAVALLENSDRVIKLKLPVSGDLNDPKFNYQSIVELVVAKGVKEGALAFLSQSLQPYSAIFSLASAAVEANRSGRFIQLQPVPFAAVGAELDASALDYMTKLAGMMAERPGLSLEICPLTLAAEEQQLLEQMQADNRKARPPLDAAALEQAWMLAITELAAERAEAIRGQLISEGVAAERLFPCRARSGVAEGEPRVELAF